MQHHDKKFELLKEFLDAVIDDCKMEGTIQHSDAVVAIDNLQREVNRKEFLGRDRA